MQQQGALCAAEAAQHCQQSQDLPQQQQRPHSSRPGTCSTHHPARHNCLQFLLTTTGEVVSRLRDSYSLLFSWWGHVAVVTAGSMHTNSSSTSEGVAGMTWEIIKYRLLLLPGSAMCLSALTHCSTQAAVGRASAMACAPHNQPSTACPAWQQLNVCRCPSYQRC